MSKTNETDNCARWEAAVVDLLDGTLAPEEEAAFRKHAETCEPCEVLLREASHGRDWARLLHESPPVVPEALLGKILAKTAAAEMGDALVPGLVPGLVTQGSADLKAGALPAGNVLLLPAASWGFRGQREARVLMTAAMAFFSIALTLSMTGFHLGDLKAAAHSPSSLGATASRQFFDTKKQVVSFYDNLRLVREMEATVEDLRHTASDEMEKTKRPEHPQPVSERTPTAVSPLLASGHYGFSIQADERTTL